MSEELKPCPFCEGVPTISRDPHYDCCACGQPVGNKAFTEIWQTRPIEDALRAEVTEYKTALMVFGIFRDENGNWDVSDRVRENTLKEMNDELRAERDELVKVLTLVLQSVPPAFALHRSGEVDSARKLIRRIKEGK